MKIENHSLFLVFIVLFIISCNSFSYKYIEDGMEFTYDYEDEEVKQQIKNLMTQKCGSNDYQIVSTEEKVEHKTWNYSYTTYEDSQVKGNITTKNKYGYNTYESEYSGTISTPKTNVVPMNYTETYYVTKAVCNPDTYDDDLEDANPSSLTKIEKEFLKKNYIQCMSKSTEIINRKVGCLEAILLIENNYKRQGTIPPKDELKILGNASYTYCVLDPSYCYTVKQYLDLNVE